MRWHKWKESNYIFISSDKNMMNKEGGKALHSEFLNELLGCDGTNGRNQIISSSLRQEHDE